MRASINSLPHPGVATLMPLRCCRFIAADNRCASGVRAALPELVLIYEPLPITTQARHYATRGSIMTAALPFGCGLSVWLSHTLTLQKRQSTTGQPSTGNRIGHLAPSYCRESSQKRGKIKKTILGRLKNAESPQWRGFLFDKQSV